MNNLDALKTDEKTVHTNDEGEFGSDEEKFWVHMDDEVDIFDTMVSGLNEALPYMKDPKERYERESKLAALRLQWGRVKRAVKNYSIVKR